MLKRRFATGLLVCLIWLLGERGAMAAAPQAAAAPPARPAPAGLTEKLQAAMKGFEGTVSIAARNLDTGAAVGIRENEPVRTASTIKLPIMVACFQAVKAGKAKWKDQIAISAASKVSGSGVIREFEDGRRLSLRDLVHMMIVVSDNTATNLVLEHVGADAVNETMAGLGYVHTRAMRKIRGDGSNLKAASGWSAEGRKEENQRFGIGRSTPAEMVDLLARLANGAIVSSTASKEMVAILERQQFKDGIGRTFIDTPVVRVASKSGALDALRSDVGLLYHPKGRLAIAITVDGMPVTDYSPDNKGNLLISKLTGILVEGLLVAP